MRAGLELVDAVGALKSHAPLQTRVGIATGLVVVGDLIGSGASQEQAIVGETPVATPGGGAAVGRATAFGPLRRNCPGGRHQQSHDEYRRSQPQRLCRALVT